MHVFVCVCVCVCICQGKSIQLGCAGYEYTYMHVCTHGHAHVHTHIRTYETHTHTYTHTHTHKHKHMTVTLLCSLFFLNTWSFSTTHTYTPWTHAWAAHQCATQNSSDQPHVQVPGIRFSSPRMAEQSSARFLDTANPVPEVSHSSLVMHLPQECPGARQHSWKERLTWAAQGQGNRGCAAMASLGKEKVAFRRNWYEMARTTTSDPAGGTFAMEVEGFLHALRPPLLQRRPLLLSLHLERGFGFLHLFWILVTENQQWQTVWREAAYPPILHCWVSA